MDKFPQYDHFSQDDFNRCSPRCQITDMNVDFMNLLEKARKIANIPFVLNSAYRSVEHEKRMYRSGYSSHCKGLAVDIRAQTGDEKYIIVNALLQVGFPRIGIHKSFIHVDLDKSKFHPCIFTY